MSLPRRQFLTQASAGLASTLLAGLVGSVPGCAPARSAVRGQLRGAGHALGHLLRTPAKIPPPTRTEEVDILLIGGGISGLSARRALHELAPARPTLLLELEAATGGNAATGHNARTAYPWGAHYLPLPDVRDAELLFFLQQAGVLTGYDPATGLPTYDETMLCHDPAERLLLYGHWQAGLVPEVGVPAADRAEIARFLAEVERLRRATGPDGRDLFALPLDLSSADAATRALDAEPMAAWLARHDYRSEYLRWYLDYSYRDDFGVPASQISAWAGLHYFAARKGRAHNAPPDAVLTWPQGNHFLAEALRRQGGAGEIRSNTLVFSLTETADGRVEALAFDNTRQQTTRLRARQVVMATPWHVSQHLLPAVAGPALAPLHAPWLVANLTVAAYPGGAGQPLSWDNVRYGSPALGYIDAEHQALRGFEVEGPHSLTFYWALPTSPADPAAARRHALASTYDQWLTLVLTELDLMHPGLAAQVQAADLWVWGHGMVAPTPGYVWGAARALAQQPRLGQRVHLAHTDFSGVSVFEEAFHQGRRAARAVLSQPAGPDFRS